MAVSYLGELSIALASAYLGLTIVYQYRPAADAIARFDRFHLLPRWTFFAPRPASKDGHLIARYELVDGTMSLWENVEMDAPRGRFDPIWNPGKRARKVISDCINGLKLVHQRHGPGPHLKFYIPYLTFLNLVDNLARGREDVRKVQFAIIETSGRLNRRIWVYFVSELHPVEFEL
jgi:hypothetical protein